MYKQIIPLDIDLSYLLKREPRLIPGELVELKMIEYYKYYQREDDSIYFHFTKYLLNLFYLDKSGTTEYELDEIYNFIKEDVYEHVVMEFNNMLDLVIMNKIQDMDFENIVFDSYIQNDGSNLIVRFNIIKDGEI